MLLFFAFFPFLQITQFFVIRCMNGKVTQLVTDFFQLRIRSLFLIQPFGKFHLQALNRG